LSTCENQFKGLNKSEIENALRRAGAYEAAQNNSSSQSLLDKHIKTVVSVNKNQVMNQKQSSIWRRVFKWIRNIIIAGCLAYTAYKKLIEVTNLTF
jgi:hypothetical protein